MHRFLWNTIPSFFLWLDKKITGGRLSASMLRFGHYMLYDRHPVVLVFFLVLLIGGEYMYLPGVWPFLTTVQQLTAALVIAGPFLFLWLSAASDPGYVTPANHQLQMAQYPFDFALFHPGAHCRTCQLLKPARSKHCSICKHCIARADHHCIFINNCVGVGNLHWFILLLLSTAVLTAYGAYLGLELIGAAVRARWPVFSVWPPAARGIDWSTYLIMWSYGIQTHVGRGAVTMLTLLTSPLVWGLWVYNMYSESDTHKHTQTHTHSLYFSPVLGHTWTG